ncbi:hypothetical protein BGZ82_005696 [Podila clonocystis]|nr:hypothetical protein BGZ82_005696 [Podila clonocystis]
MLHPPHLSKISPLSWHPMNDEHTLWTPLIEIVHTLSIGPLSSIELGRHAGTLSFWSALSTCTRLNSIKLSDLTLKHRLFVPFWRTVSRIESIHLRNATAIVPGHPFQPIFRKRFFRLKHVVRP